MNKSIKPRKTPQQVRTKCNKKDPGEGRSLYSGTRFGSDVGQHLGGECRCPLDVSATSATATMGICEGSLSTRSRSPAATRTDWI